MRLRAKKLGRRWGCIVAPAMLAALCVVLYKLSSLGQSDTVLAAALARAKGNGQALTQSDADRLYPPLKSSENAEATLRLAVADVKRLEASLGPIKDRLDPKTEKPWTPAEVESAVVVAEPIANLVTQAVAFPHLHWRQSPVTFFTDADHSRLKLLCRVMAVRARSLARKGNGLMAMRDVRTAVRLSELVGDEPSTIAVFVYFVMEDMALAALGYVLEKIPLDPPILAELKLISEDFRPLRDAADVVRFDVYSVEQFVKSLKSADDYVRLIHQDVTNEKADFVENFVWNYPGLRPLVRAKMLDNISDLIECSERSRSKPYSDQVAAERKVQDQIEADTSIPSKLLYPFGQGFGLFTTRRFEREAKCECLRALVDAIELSGPKRLSELTVPIKTSKVFRDPFTGGRILSHRDQLGLRIYATGNNQIDDGGELRGLKPFGKGTDVGILIGRPPTP